MSTDGSVRFHSGETTVRRRTADKVTRARVLVSIRGAEVELVAVALVRDEVGVTVRRLTPRDIRDRVGGDESSEGSESDERGNDELHTG